MAGNNGNGRGDRRPNPRDEPNGPSYWEVGLGVLGAAALIGGAVYGLSSIFNGDQTEQREEQRPIDQQASTSTAVSSWTSYRPVGSCSGTRIAVDATPAIGGGILILPNKRTVRYYSLDWSSHLQFPVEPDKFEITNAFIGLKLWKGLCPFGITIKVDNSKFNTERNRVGDDYWRKVKEEIDEVGGKLVHASAKQDPEFKMADRMSRGFNVTGELSNMFPGWRIVCDSDSAEWVLEGQILQEIPQKYHKRR